MLEIQEINALLQIIGRADFKGEEIPSVNALIHKLQTMAQPKAEETPAKINKKD
jgi:hypothetical protein